MSIAQRHLPEPGGDPQATNKHRRPAAQEAADHLLPILSKYAADPVIAPLLIDFARDLPAQMNELAQAAQPQLDQEKVRRLSHRLKGDAATYGYPELAHAAQQIEERAGALGQDPALLTRLLAALHIMARRVLSGVNGP